MIREYAIVSLLVTWFVATVVYQCFLSRLKYWTARYDRFRILPAWRFFAGIPREHDFECRYELGDGSTTDWQTTRSSAPRRLLTTVWNPGYMVPDLVLTWTDELLDCIDSSSGSQLAFIDRSFPYRALLRCLKNFAPAAPIRGQFRIVEHLDAGGEDRVLMTSPWHALDEVRGRNAESLEQKSMERECVDANAGPQFLRKAA